MTNLLFGVVLGAVLFFFISKALKKNRPIEKAEQQLSVAMSHAENVEEPWRVVIDALPLGVIVVDAGGQEIIRNGVASSVSGARHAEVLVDVVAEKLLRFALTGSMVEEEVKLAGPPLRVLVVRAVPLHDNGAMVTIEDITEQARLDQVRTDFVANVSHELKTPVGAISVLAETLEGETQDELVLRLSGRMVSECERMARTIDDLLELSRIEMGGEMLVAPVKLHDVVREAVERAQLLAEHKNIALKVDEKADAIVQGDFYQLVSAVGNLVDNAVKYSDEGSSVEIQITSNAQNANIAVQDHGVGIPADGIERIFERFYRVDRARSRGTGGTGLGLSIVRHVATNHEGDVSVSSREGEGSTFVLRLPVRSE
jgi:two-component system sensor histidine kinase SenX3